MFHGAILPVNSSPTSPNNPFSPYCARIARSSASSASSIMRSSLFIFTLLHYAERGLKFFARGHQTGLHRARRNAERRGDFRDAHVLLIKKGYRGALLGRQRRHRRDKSRRRRARFDPLGAVKRRPGLGGESGGAATRPSRASHEIRGAARHDAKGESREGGAIVEPSNPARNVDPCVLRNVAGVLDISGQAVRVAQQPLFPAPRQGRQRPRIARARRRGEVFIEDATLPAVHERGSVSVRLMIRSFAIEIRFIAGAILRETYGDLSGGGTDRKST